jgi:hypothetical protein
MIWPYQIMQFIKFLYGFITLRNKKSKCQTQKCENEKYKIEIRQKWKHPENWKKVKYTRKKYKKKIPKK